MPYSKAHKLQTRIRILESARNLFSRKGFDRVSIDEVMEDCGLSRGGFYTHFYDKATLYFEAMENVLGHDQEQSEVRDSVGPRTLSGKLNACLLDDDRANYERTALAFLGFDLTHQEPKVRSIYQDAFREISRQFQREQSGLGYHDALAQSAMAVGVLALSLTIDSEELKLDLFRACQQTSPRLVNMDEEAFFWAVEPIAESACSDKHVLAS